MAGWLSRREFRATVIAAIWTANGLLWTSQTLVTSSLEGRDYPLRAALLQQMGLAAIWALLTPLILWLGRRFPLGQKAWPASVALHLSASVALAFPLSVAKVLLARAAGRSPALSAPLLDRSLVSFVGWFDMDLLMYWIVLGVGQAFAYSRILREREVRAAELQTQLAEARLAALESQLHPHFLFNALHSIAALVRTNQNAHAIRVVAGLGDLLRRALDRAGSPEVPLKQELEFVERYLDIERVRFGDRLKVSLDFPPETLDACVPYLILQPLVENAIRHGIGKRALAERVEIRGVRENGCLRVLVTDDGPGLGANGDARRPGGVGLNNVRERLEQLYGSRQRFEIRNAAGGGVEAEISLPFRLAAEEWGGRT